jgi:uncharacterized protein YukJ
MPLKNCGVLKGWAIDRRQGSGRHPHYQIHMIDEIGNYRFAVNMLWKLAPSELEYLIDSRLDHPYLCDLEDLPAGWARTATAAWRSSSGCHPRFAAGLHNQVLNDPSRPSGCIEV